MYVYIDIYIFIDRQKNRYLMKTNLIQMFLIQFIKYIHDPK